MISSVLLGSNRTSIYGRFAIAALAMVVSFGFSIVSCVALNPSIHYILPNGYVGVFRIQLDEREGVEVKAKAGGYTYEIPASGVLKVKTFAPFQPMHEETAAYKNGAVIELTGSNVSDEAVALRSLGTYRRGDGPPTIAFVIGTKQEEDKLRIEMYSSDFDKAGPRASPQPTPERR